MLPPPPVGPGGPNSGSEPGFPVLSPAPNLALPPGSPLSSMVTRNVTLELFPEASSNTPSPQISRRFGNEGSQRYPVILVLLRCMGGLVLWSRAFTCPQNAP